MRTRAGAGSFVIAVAAATLGFGAPAQAATIEPTVFFDGMMPTGNCTLREAVEASNLNEAVDACEAGDANKRDTIQLQAGEYNLTIDGEDNDNSTGDLDVTPEIGSGPLRVRGEGIDVTTIDAENDDRVIQLYILNDPGSLAVTDLTALGNEERVTSGGVIAASQGELVVERVEVADGEAQFGGGISCSSCDKFRLTDSNVHNNKATTTSTGAPGVEARGGAISVSGENAAITNTSVIANEAFANDSVAIGGGIYMSGEVELRGSYIGTNQTRSSTNNAIATRAGGGVYVDDDSDPGAVTIVNTTFSANFANFTGAASQGGGLAVEGDSTVDVFGTTLVDNDASAGEQVHAQNGAKIEVAGSILASIGNGVVCAQDGGTIRSKGYNVLDDQPALAAACMDGPQSTKDEIAEPSVSFTPIGNGGPTSTYVISSSSPALDLVPKKKCKPAGKADQRGVERPNGKGCDAGSYERTECADSLIDGQSIVGTSDKDKLTGTAAEDVFAPTAGADKLKASDGDDRICSGSGDDELKGGDGADMLRGDKGKDDCDGGQGNDSGKSCEKEKSL